MPVKVKILRSRRTVSVAPALAKALVKNGTAVYADADTRISIPAPRKQKTDIQTQPPAEPEGNLPGGYALADVGYVQPNGYVINADGSTVFDENGDPLRFELDSAGEPILEEEGDEQEEGEEVKNSDPEKKELTAEGAQPKRRGRPKKQTYQTKDVVAE